MPTLVFPNADFVAFTKILSADVNGKFNAIKTLLNTTKLDSTNVQAGGLTVDRLATTGGSAGQFVGTNGTSVLYISNPISSQYNIIMGNATDVTNGVATNSTWTGYTQQDGDRVLQLPTYVGSENVSITKKIYLHGLGNTTQITGTLTLASGSSYSTIKNIRVTSTITLNSGANGIFINEVHQASGQTVADNGTGNLVTIITE